MCAGNEYQSSVVVVVDVSANGGNLGRWITTARWGEVRVDGEDGWRMEGKEFESGRRAGYLY